MTEQPKFAPWQWPPTDYSPAAAIDRFFRDGESITPKGRDGIIGRCEDALCKRFHQPRAVLCCSGTMALYAAFFAVGVENGDEVICPTITFHASVTPAIRLGARVVLVDVDEETACILPSALEAAITDRTKAVVTNAQWGHPVEQDEIRAICNRRGIAWIEDISHAHGAEFNNRQVGTWGDLCCVSLGAEKILTAGMAGALMGSSDELVDRAVLVTHFLHRAAKDVRSPGFGPVSRTGFGLKLGVHPLAAAVILDQLENQFDRWVGERKTSLEKFRNALSDLPGIRPPVIRPQVTSMGGWYGFKPWVDFHGLGITREDLVGQLRSAGAEVDVPGSPPLHSLPLFEDPQWSGWPESRIRNAKNQYPNADRYSTGTLSIPTFTGPRDELALNRGIEAFQSVWRHLGFS